MIPYFPVRYHRDQLLMLRSQSGRFGKPRISGLPGSFPMGKTETMLGARGTMHPTSESGISENERS